MKPGNLHELFHDMRWCQPDARGKPLNDKSERLRSHYSFPHVKYVRKGFFYFHNECKGKYIQFFPYYNDGSFEILMLKATTA